MRFENLIPVLDVKDVDASIKFYCDALGFSLHDKVEWGGRTEWAHLRTGKVQLMLCASDDETIEESVRAHDGVFFVYLDNIEALHVYLGSKGHEMSVTKGELAQSKKDFFVRDPDGYVLWFTHRQFGSPVLDMPAPSRTLASD